jgi:hypothetical protein
MTNSRLAIVGLATGMLLAATPALAGNGRAAPVACSGQTVEQTGPKYLPCTGSSPQRTITATKGGIQVTLRTLCEDELGPKYLPSHC